MAHYENLDSRYDNDYGEMGFDPDEKFVPSQNPRHGLNPAKRHTGKLTKKELRSRKRQSIVPSTPHSRGSFEFASLRRRLRREDSVVLAALAKKALSPYGRRAMPRDIDLGASLLTASQSEWLYLRNYANRPAGKETQFNHIVTAHQQAINEHRSVLYPTLGEVITFGVDDEATKRKRFLAIQLQGTDADIAEFETVDLQAALGKQRSRLLNYQVHISVGTLAPGEPAEPPIEALQHGLASLAETRGLTVALGEACLTMHQYKA